MKDIFYLDKVFPEAEKVFSETYKSVGEIIRDCIIVLDTNVLLLPYDTNESSVRDIKEIFLNYRNKDRLRIPARVAREFANNRATKISEVFLKVRQIKDNLNSGTFKIGKYPLLEGIKHYDELLKNFENIQKSLKSARRNLDEIETQIQSWTWDDIVSVSYKEIFTKEIIGEVTKSKKDIEEDLAFRIEYKIAPGYKDSKKPDDGVGDLVIWQTILEIGKELGKDVLFVTNDQKNDWFYKQAKMGLYPKFELFDEFRRFTGGKSLGIINFLKFLELSHAKAETLKEVQSSINESSMGEFRTNVTGLIEGMQIEHSMFGRGQVMKITKTAGGELARVVFSDGEEKHLHLEYAPIRILDTGLNFLLRNPDFDGDPKTYQFGGLDAEELD